MTPARRAPSRAGRRPTPAQRRRVLPALDADGPHVRLGLAWAAVSLGAIAVSSLASALVFSAVAIAAAAQAARSRKRLKRRASRPVAVGGAGLVAISAVGGPVAVAAAAAVVGVISAIAGRSFGGRRYDGRLTAATALFIGTGLAAPTIVRSQSGPTAALVLVLSVHVFDAANFVVGVGGNAWEGMLAGAASVAALSLAAAAVLVPPFRGVSPWVLGGIAIVLAPAGTALAAALLPSANAPAPALRRVDALLVVAPVWALAAKVVLA